ncbi:hypothetical protein ACTD5D_13575 [Nocardia takedensis]|uniref:hypothetical protein n=1 Tax=Nocardia takedensis TaxID=259390 RepID=UPI0002F25BE5|nr:hypothetical protein [Nocardia takedensis]
MNSTVMRSHAAGVVGLALVAAAGCAGGGEQSVAPDLAAAPTEVRWQDFRGVVLPHTAQGPRSVTEGAAAGFDRSPPGAAVAAITHTVRLSVAADGQWSSVVARSVVPGPARDEWSVNRLQLSITGPATPEFAPRLLGYRIADYTDRRGAVEIYTEYSDGSRAVNHTTVEWFRDDWRLRLPDPGSTTPPLTALDELPDDIVTLEAPK